MRQKMKFVGKGERSNISDTPTKLLRLMIIALVSAFFLPHIVNVVFT